MFKRNETTKIGYLFCGHAWRARPSAGTCSQALPGGWPDPLPHPLRPGPPSGRALRPPAPARPRSRRAPLRRLFPARLAARREGKGRCAWGASPTAWHSGARGLEPSTSSFETLLLQVTAASTSAATAAAATAAAAAATAAHLAEPDVARRLLEDVLQARRQRAAGHREAQAVSLAWIDVRVLPEEHDAHAGQAARAQHDGRELAAGRRVDRARRALGAHEGGER